MRDMARRRGRDKTKTPIGQTPTWAKSSSLGSRPTGSLEGKVVTTPTAPAVVSEEEQRAEVARELADLGKRRLRLVGQLKDVDGDLRPAVIKAARAGLPYRRIEELTGVSRATVGRWART